jgi:hypothetical protein
VSAPARPSVLVIPVRTASGSLVEIVLRPGAAETHDEYVELHALLRDHLPAMDDRL